MYTYEEALKNSEQYFNGNDLSAKIFVDKYALRDEYGNIIEDTPEKTHRRLAREFARIEKKKFKTPYSEEYLFSLFDKFLHIIPQGSPTFAIGNDYQIASASNCFVVESPEDSYGGICKTDQELVQISKRRGGVGLDLSKLRPKGSITKNSSRTSTGIKSWMQRYSNSIREVGQAGRRGALMMTVSVHHPDIIDFVTAKNNGEDVTGANISVRLSDEFLNAVESNTDYELRFPVDSKNPKISTKVSARNMWNLIIKNAWLRAEPGLLFWDNIINESIPDCYDFFKTLSTNPCGEITLSANDSCRLLVINLMKFVKNAYCGPSYDNFFDFAEFYKSAQIAQRLMDDLVDLELEKIQAIIDKIEADPENTEIKQVELNLWKKMYEAAERGRRTGLGITALGDAIAAVGIKYGSDASIEFTEQIYKTLKFGSYRASIDMSAELGPFPDWDWEYEKDNPFLQRIQYEELEMYADNCPCRFCSDCEVLVSGQDLYTDMEIFGRRNIANLTTAPVGTMSMLAGFEIDGKIYFGTTSGIEPVYTWKPYTRRKKGNPGDNNFRSDFVDQSGDHWMEFDVYHTGLLAWKNKNQGGFTIEESPYYGGSAEEIVWTQRVKLQAAAQKHVDHSISSTVNLPADVSEEEVSKIYNEAWKSGCKGITVYRDGCRTGVLVKKEDKKTEEKISQINAPKRPKELKCDIYNISVNKQKYTVIVGLLDNLPYEVFCVSDYIDKHKHGILVKNGKGSYIVKTEDGEVSLSNYLEDDTQNALLRLISTSLRHGASINFIVEQLLKTKGDFASFNKCIARSLKKYINDGTSSTEKCECGSALVYQEGCLTCKSCGYSKCS